MVIYCVDQITKICLIFNVSQVLETWDTIGRLISISIVKHKLRINDHDQGNCYYTWLSHIDKKSRHRDSQPSTTSHLSTDK